MSASSVSSSKDMDIVYQCPEKYHLCSPKSKYRQSGAAAMVRPCVRSPFLCDVPYSAVTGVERHTYDMPRQIFQSPREARRMKLNLKREGRFIPKKDMHNMKKVLDKEFGFTILDMSKPIHYRENMIDAALAKKSKSKSKSSTSLLSKIARPFRNLKSSSSKSSTRSSRASTLPRVGAVANVAMNLPMVDNALLISDFFSDTDSVEMRTLKLAYQPVMELSELTEMALGVHRYFNSRLNQLSRCEKCEELFTTQMHIPYGLSCSHRVCWKCIQDYNKNEGTLERDGVQFVKCPIDRSLVKYAKIVSLPSLALTIENVDKKEQYKDIDNLGALSDEIVDLLGTVLNQKLSPYTKKIREFFSFGKKKF